MTNVDIVRCLARFVPDKQFLFFAPVSRSWKDAWGERATVTSWITPHTTPFQLQYRYEPALFVLLSSHENCSGLCSIPRNMRLM